MKRYSKILFLNLEFTIFLKIYQFENFYVYGTLMEQLSIHIYQQINCFAMQEVNNERSKFLMVRRD